MGVVSPKLHAVKSSTPPRLELFTLLLSCCCLMPVIIEVMQELVSQAQLSDLVNIQKRLWSLCQHRHNPNSVLEEK